MSASESSPDRDPFERLAEEFAARLRRGEHPSLTEYIERYPEHAGDIRELFPALALVERFKPERLEIKPAGTDSGPAPAGALPERLGDYRILRYLGEGGMGVVYEAVRESLSSHVALKVMHAQFRTREGYLRRFRTEARSAARLHHTNIVSVFDYGVHSGACYYAMQYIAGQSLDKIVSDLRQLRHENGPWPSGSAAALPSFAAACAGAPPAARDNSRAAAGADSPSDLLRQSVTVGLLTGHYGTAAAHGLPSDPDEPTSELAASIAAPTTAEPTQPFERGEELARHLDQPRRNSRRVFPPDKEKGQDAYFPSPADSTSSLAGKTDDRFYREVARLGAQVADALAYAHKRGVLHRDIKPPNLILDGLGNTWVTDFGLAKSEDGDDVSQSRDVVGTLRYMAPERFRGASDRRCDVYALGATLYELATLRPPFEGKDQLELIHRIELEPPVPLRQLEPRIPRDLETIVLKALAKNPGDRFATAEEMAGELRRFVENRPIRSRPLPFYQQFWRWCQRNPKLAAANVTAAVLTTVLAIVSTAAAWFYREHGNQISEKLFQLGVSEAEARAARAEARRELFQSRLDQARASRFSKRIGQRFQSLDALAKAAALARGLRLPSRELDPLRDEAIACLALPDLKPTGRVIQRPPGVVAIAFDSTLSRYAFRFRDGTIHVHRVADDEVIARFQARGDRDIFVFHFSPDGRYLATRHYPDHGLMVWDVDRSAVALNLPGRWWARFSPDGRRILAENNARKAQVYDLASGQPLSSWRATAPVGWFAFRADGTLIASLYDRTCRILDAETGRVVRSFPVLSHPDSGVAWSPDGTTLATNDSDVKIGLWDAATGIRKATLEGHTNGGVSATFHPAGTLLASNGWEGRLWLWDPVLGRPWLNLAGGTRSEFSRDGRMVIEFAGEMTEYQVDPALEYRTFAHVSSQPLTYGWPSIRHDGRLLAVGTSRGIALWDLARGAELGFLPIGLARYTMFNDAGDLITSGPRGVHRWPFRLDSQAGKFRIGPPQQLPLPAGPHEIDVDRSGQVVARADGVFAFFATSERTFHVGPLDDCRSVAVSPDGRWLATGTHGKNGAQVWRLRDATRVAHLNFDGLGGVAFSPDGKWLMNAFPPCRLWAVGTWQEVRQIGGAGVCFSSDGRLLVVQDASSVLSLVELETGRTLAHLESPDLCAADFRKCTFSPDGSRLVAATNDGPAVHVWDLRAIRRHLAGMGLDWDAPPFSDDDPASAALPPLPPLEVDYGPTALAGRLDPKVYEPVIADLETALARHPQERRASGMLALYCNNYAWQLATAPAASRNSERALSLARRAVEVVPAQGVFMNTLGVAQYRGARYAEATATLKRSLAENGNQFAGFDLFPLAMAQHWLGDTKAARDCFDRAVRWLGEQKSLDEQSARDLAAFRAEAEAVLAGPAGELPDDVFAPQ
jgi:serine/threonine protein kinase/WD40 repeat protein